MSSADELLLRIGRAAVIVDELRERRAAAKKARNKIACRRECNVMGGGRSIVEPCWKRFKEIPRHYDAPDVVRLPLSEQCGKCRRRFIRQQAYAAESRKLAGARRRVTILARRYRREHGEAR